MSLSSSSRRVLIAEGNVTGHRLNYARILADAAVMRGDSVVVALRASSKGSPEIGIHLHDIDPQIRIVYGERFDLDGLADLSREFASDLLVVADGDARAMDLGRSGRWVGSGNVSLLVMREVGQPSPVPGLQRIKTWMRLALFRRAARTPHVRVVVLKSSGWSGDSRFKTAIDPITLVSSESSVDALRLAWDLDRNHYWFAILGAISARKNVEMVANALAHISRGHVGLLLAGKNEDSSSPAEQNALSRLRASGAKLTVVDRLLTDGELDAAVSAADCLVLAHSNEGPSGMLGKARAAGTRVVASGAVSLRADLAKADGIGSWVPLDMQALAEAFEIASGLPRPDKGEADAIDSFTRALL